MALQPRSQVRVRSAPVLFPTLPSRNNLPGLTVAKQRENVKDWWATIGEDMHKQSIVDTFVSWKYQVN